MLTFFVILGIVLNKQLVCTFCLKIIYNFAHEYAFCFQIVRSPVT